MAVVADVDFVGFYLDEQDELRFVELPCQSDRAFQGFVLSFVGHSLRCVCFSV